MQIALTIAGSDSGAGAGIQADLKTFQRFGVYGTTAITAITAQNTRGVGAVHVLPIEIVEAELAALAEDLPPSATKSGMLATTGLVRAVARAIEHHGFFPYVLDPVMVATSGDRLLDQEAQAEITRSLIPLAAIVTPNLPEAAILTGRTVENSDDMERAGRALLAAGAGAALVKGGHLPGDDLVDVLVTEDGVQRFPRKRIATTSTHGTGCVLSAAITAGLALAVGRSDSRTVGRAVPADVLRVVVRDALDYVQHALLTAPELGGGHGPVA